MTKTKPIVYSGSGSAIDNYNSEKPVKTENWGVFDAKNKQHRTIMALCRNRQWVKPDDKHPSGQVADMDGAFSDFLKSDRSPVKKPLMDMKPQELTKIIVAMSGVVRHKWSK
ncbi:hypothetical protein J0383_07925 [Flavobacterium endoglycinae]|uniref:Uncharacterized protein n=1 Tax=Flavobacterium endoglycinae TaxID=2816357 RepID=A0ABX7QIF5_9FLAO|nr:hypothetical protein [Flavobacterium endoglycinae]QSW90727.1 hypothetical protein J0383_07925 [Flavobacterium endoglycinae]